jgi:hypothetical protein
MLSLVKLETAEYNHQVNKKFTFKCQESLLSLLAQQSILYNLLTSLVCFTKCNCGILNSKIFNTVTLVKKAQEHLTYEV